MKIMKPIVLAATLGIVGLSSEAFGCPNCKDALAQNDPAAMGLVQGYFWSILFMVSMPFTIFAGMSAYFYLLVRRARRSAGAASLGSHPLVSRQAMAPVDVANEAVAVDEVLA